MCIIIHYHNVLAHLAVINSAIEESLIAKYQAECGLGDIWIGYYDQFKKDQWITVMDQDVDVIGYLHWNVGEPNNADGSERCVTYDRTGMNDLNCAKERPFVCKFYLK